MSDDHTLAEQVEHLQKKIFGNGTPGLLSDMRVMQNELETLKSTSLDNNRRLVKIERVFYMGFGAGVVLQFLLQYLFKHGII